MSYLPLLKPHQLEKLETLTWKAKHDLREKLFIEQHGVCACGCGQFMCRLQGVFASVTLDHKTPNKMGCRKQDAAFNLRAVRWECNTKKGSKRIAGASLCAVESSPQSPETT